MNYKVLSDIKIMAFETDAGTPVATLTEDAAWKNQLPPVELEFDADDVFVTEKSGDNFVYEVGDVKLVITSETWYNEVAMKVRAFETVIDITNKQ
jgi:hypothetical protein